MERNMDGMNISEIDPMNTAGIVYNLLIALHTR